MGYCESCAKVRECKKTIGIMFGYCETDYLSAVDAWLDATDGRLTETKYGYLVEWYGESAFYKTRKELEAAAHYNLVELGREGMKC